MKTPFTQEQFLEVFEAYNLFVWPIQVLFYLIAILAIYIIVKRTPQSGKVVTIVLASLWLWMGLVYHIGFFSKINGAAYIFGVAFIVQALLFIYLGVFKKPLYYSLELKNKYHLLGILFIIYALVIYPITGYFAGHAYPSAPTFGLPCPTTIFTFGILLFTVKRVSLGLIIIPLLWSLIGFSAALNFGIIEDTGLIIAGLVSSFLLVWKNRQLNNSITSEATV